MASLESQTVEMTVEDRVAWVTLNRPDALNAWTEQLGHDANAALDAASADPDVRAVVITGAGRAFSSGADLKSGKVDENGRIDVAAPLREVYNPLILRARTLPKPVIAAVNGACVGIGCSLALACDLIIASEEAYFLMAFVNIGLTLDGGSSVLLPQVAGHPRAFEIAYLGDRIPATRALHWGLINRVVPGASLREETATLAARLAAGPPGSYAATKKLINANAYAELAEHMERETDEQQRRADSKDFIEGVVAFAEKRPARFTGE